MMPIQASARSTGAYRLTVRRGDIALFVGAVLLPLAIFAGLAAVSAGNGARLWDSPFLRLTERYYSSSVGPSLGLALDAGRVVAAAIVLGVLILLLRRRRWRALLFCTLAVGGVLAIDVPLKEVFHRPQWTPPGYDSSGGGYAFPSGHAMASVAILGALTLLSPRRWAKVLLIVGVPLAVAVGVVLVYSWWHYPSDVVAGWSLALAWVSALWLAIRPGPGALR
jgi:membrane-associated phospholipid phosphatase